MAHTILAGCDGKVSLWNVTVSIDVAMDESDIEDEDSLLGEDLGDVFQPLTETFNVVAPGHHDISWVVDHVRKNGPLILKKLGYADSEFELVGVTRSSESLFLIENSK